MPTFNKRFVASCLALSIVFPCVPARAIARQVTSAISNSELPATRSKQVETQGEVQEALIATEARKNDPDAWFRLGIAYNKAGNNQEARKAFQRALKIRSSHAEARAGLAYTLLIDGKLLDAEREAKYATDAAKDSRFQTASNVLQTVRLTRYRVIYAQALQAAEAALKSNPNHANAHLIKSHALIGLTLPEPRLLPDLSQPLLPPAQTSEEERTALRSASAAKYKEAANSLERYLQLQPNASEADYLRERLQTIKFYSQEAIAPDNERIATSSLEATTRIRITRKPEPGYTTKARAANVNGTVMLRLLLAADGKVMHILALNDLGYGLTEKAVQAARQIRFEPAAKNGAPVSTFAQINYSFSIY